MTKEIQNPDDHAQRVSDVLVRANALSEELRRTITELTTILRAHPEESTGGNGK